MNTLYRKVLCGERLPDNTEYQDTDDGEAQCIDGKWYWENCAKPVL